MGSLNYFEFEGEIITLKKGDGGERQAYIWLEGLTPSGYTTSVTFEVTDKMVDELSKTGKHDRVSICGHIELRSRLTDTGKIRKRVVLVTDKIISVKESGGYEFD